MAKAKERKEGPETKLVRSMIDYLNKRGHFAWRNNTGKRQIAGRWISFGFPGSGDIFVVVQPHGRFLSVEAKVGTGKATELQQEFIDRVRASGGVAGVARSLDELDKLVAEAAHETSSLF